jgi:hypothetical protein
MTGFDGICFLTHVDTITTASTMTALQNNTGSGTGDATEATVSTGTDDNTLILDVYRPTDRYVQVQVARGVSTVVGEIYALQYRAREVPVTNDRAGYSAAYWPSPDES